MEVSARLRACRVSARKCRLVVDRVRGLAVGDALELLRFGRTRPAFYVLKVLESAIANAENNEGADIDELKIKRITVDEGPVMKRFRPRAKGRASAIIKRTSHIGLVLSDA
ncbi:MAG: 50S ribosomal protein L22 [Gammaproteobacteria bacterium]|nr:50S ribosomal protein L22 [Gammaproteobacteria bacterium]MDD9807659.1 50S ribosomal protein L22 [Gammaproteobacteria bacterium]MDD9869392.1 50S ribosomal protein L22 [Gammaproteobacteria bacterium]MDD9886582.1 50S ribosomal protein L22 [Gammaproteobacteria bacterium]